MSDRIIGVVSLHVTNTSALSFAMGKKVIRVTFLRQKSVVFFAFSLNYEKTKYDIRWKVLSL